MVSIEPSPCLRRDQALQRTTELRKLQIAVDKILAMRLFASVAREGTLADAARTLEVAPSVASRQLAELEQHLGARLINRTTRRLVLTEIGARYLQSVQQILVSLDDAEALVRDETHLVQGRLRVQVTSAFACHQLIQHLGRFRGAHPQVALELSVSPVVTMINENFDVCLLMVEHEPPDNGMVARVLANSEIVCCASPGYFDRCGRPRHPTDLVRHDLVVPHNLRREVHFRRLGLQGLPTNIEPVMITLPPAAFDSNDIELNYLAALGGIGIAGLPSFVAAEGLRSGRLEQVLADWQVQRLRLFAAVPTRRHLPARARVFVDFLCECFGGNDADPWTGVAAGQ